MNSFNKGLTAAFLMFFFGAGIYFGYYLLAGKGESRSSQAVAEANDAIQKANNAAFERDNLANLIVLNGIFETTDAKGLAQLIAIDNITGDDSFNTNTDDLADLLVLNGLFGNNSATDLAQLIAVNNIIMSRGF